MAEDIITIRENSTKDLDFELSLKEEEYLKGGIFNRGRRKNIEVFYSRQRKPIVRVGPYAGIIQLTKRRIHFSTKVDVRLFYMLSFLKSEDEFLYDPETPIEIREGVNFFDIIGKFFLNYLHEILRMGLLKKYVRKKENLRFLKGKIMIKEQIKQNLVDKSRFFCEYEDLTFDNLENRIVLSALHSVISLIRFNRRIKNELRRYEAILKEFISLVRINPADCNFVKFNRVNQHYEGIMKLSKLILEERFIRSIHKGESRGFNFIVNMNKVYEDFITEIIEEIIDHDPEFKEFKIEKQPRFNKLVKERTMITRPDIVIRKGRKTYPFIVDTKYKREDSNADYYQVIAYSLALRHSKACCLIYPESEKSKISKEPLTLIRDLTAEIPDEVKLYARTVNLYIPEVEKPNYEDYINRIKAQIKSILLDFIEEFN
ncbi:MAG: McrC family protein [Candidatus Bathyarchaeota archaeon]|nr:McrC family protein [Candidatus Bathyarchaeota archaeon]MDH5779056.1 McrC family protein [Candidatus Bathyarchaeota archaeon]